MKKLLTLLVVAAMVLCFSSVAFASTLTDIGDLNKDTQAAIGKLDALNVIDGYPDGTFKPANTITRAEFAKIAVLLASMGDAEKGLQNTPSKFTDVKTGAWYTGYVNLCTSQGFLTGYPDGTFRPNNIINYQEVVTILLRILGYDSNLPGTWPTEYIAKAAALGVTEDVDFNAAAPATRSDVAVMAEAALDQYMVTWNADSQNFTSAYAAVATNDDLGLTLLDYSFDSVVEKDYVVQSWAKNKDTFKLEVAEFDKSWDSKDDGDDYELTDDVVILGANTVPALAGKIIDYIDVDGDIGYIEVTSKTLYSDDVDYNDDDEVEIDGTDYELAVNLKNADDIVNDDYYSVNLTEDDEVYSYTNRTEAKEDGNYDIRLVDANKGDKLTFKVSHDPKKDKGSLTGLDKKDILVVKDGKYAELADIAENDVIYVNSSPKGTLDLFLEVFSITNEGVFEADFGDKWRIDGTKYAISDNGDEYDVEVSLDNGDDFELYAEDEGLIDDVFDENVKYFLNKANQIEFLIADVDKDSETVYGVVTEVLDITSIKEYVDRIEVLKADGDYQKYDVDTDEVELVYGDELAADDFIKFRVNEDGDIDEITVLAWFVDGEIVAPEGLDSDYYDDDNDDYIVELTDGDDDKERIEINDGKSMWKYITDDTVIFNGAPDEDHDGAVIEDNDDFIDWAEEIGDSEVEDIVIYAQYDGSDIEYIYVNDAGLEGVTSDYCAVITKTWRSGSDRKVEVDVKGEANTYKQDNKNDRYTVGQVYEYYLSGSKFVDETLIFDAANPFDGGFAAVDEEAYDYIADVVLKVKDVDVDRNSIELYFDEDDDDRCDSDEDSQTFDIHEDSVLYDFSDYFDDGDAPEYIELADLEENDLVMIGFHSLSEEDIDDGYIEFIFKVNNIELPEVEEPEEPEV